MMTLRVTTPEKSLFEGTVAKIGADGVDGGRGLLPRHVDFVMPLKPGIMACTDADGADGTDAPVADADGTDGSDADGTDGGDADGTDGGDADGTDA